MTHNPLNLKLMLVGVALLSTLHAQGRGIRLLGTEAGRPGKLVTGAPYSADISNETTRTLPDGNTIHQLSSGHVYRDSQGRTREEAPLQALGAAAQGTSAPRLAFISDPVASTSYVLDMVKHAATRTAWRQTPGRGPANFSARRPHADGANIKRESLGTQVMGGLVVEGTRTTNTIPAGQIGNAQAISIVSERWYSPDLQVVVYSKRSDPRQGDTVYQLTNISRSEPAASLFAVPADYPLTDAQAHMRGRGPGVQ